MREDKTLQVVCYKDRCETGELKTKTGRRMNSSYLIRRLVWAACLQRKTFLFVDSLVDVACYTQKEISSSVGAEKRAQVLVVFYVSNHNLSQIFK